MAQIDTQKLQAAFDRFRAGDLREAERLCGEILAQVQNDPTALHLLGVVRLMGGAADEAASLIRRALEGNSGNPVMLEHLGLARLATRNYVAAETAFRGAILGGAAHGLLYMRLGIALSSQGKVADGLAALREAARRAPGDPEILNNLGNTLAEHGQDDEALSCYEAALSVQRGHPLAHYNKGTLLLRLGRPVEAEAVLRDARSAAPDDPDVSINLGTALERQGRFVDAEACYRDAVRAAPGRADAWFQVAEMCKHQGKLDEAIAAYERALAARPDYPEALGYLANQRQQVGLWQGIEDMWDRLRRVAVGNPNAALSPFDLLSFTTAPDEQLACARAFSTLRCAPYEAARARSPFRYPGPSPRRLRVGYLSWNFHEHALTSLIAEVFELHDRNRFEIFAYDYGPGDGSELRRRISSASDHFIVVQGLVVTAAAKRINDDAIDILVDLQGHTLGGLVEVMALRPAPVQVNWIGYPGTMGAECIDYIIADGFVIPEGAERHYSERVVRLPGCYLPNDRRRAIAERTPTREECGLPPAAFVFCCFNQGYKILPETFGLWMRILHAVPDSVLWLFEANRWLPDNLRREAAARGIAPERIVFMPRVARAEYLARYRVADLCLDTFPYTSHTTATDALWAGCPLVSRAGETFVSRVAGSVLASAGLQELVVSTEAEYERLVVHLARTPSELERVRQSLRQNRDTCALFDTPRFVTGLERAYEEMILAARGSSDPARE